MLEVRTQGELTVLERQAIQPNSTAVENQFIWSVISREASTVNNVGVKTLAGKLVQSEKIDVTNKNCYLLMADTSGSMKADWQNTKLALLSWIDVIPENTPYGIFGFADDLSIIKATDLALTKPEAKEKISQIELNGKNTQLFLAVSQALELSMNCSAYKKHLVIFSDGDAEDKAHTLQEVISLANAKSVSLHTVGFGDLTKSKTVLKLEVLKALSSKTKGNYYHYEGNNVIATSIEGDVANQTKVGLLTVDVSGLRYGETELLVSVEMDTPSGADSTISQRVTVTGTKKFDNFLVLISEMFSGRNPWLIIGGFFSLLLAIIVFFLWRRAKRAGDSRALLERDKKYQENQDLDMRNALAEMNEKIDAFAPEEQVNDKGEPYGWLKDNTGRYYDLVKYSSTIGRNAENDIVIDDEHVSLKHAILDYKKGKFIWTDRAPLNPTLSNGQKVSMSFIVMPGDKIKCGQTELEFVLS